jgi:hypothetical protein
MATTFAKRKTQPAAEFNHDSLVPTPSLRVRRWLFAALLLWQAIVLWCVPVWNFLWAYFRYLALNEPFDYAVGFRSWEYYEVAIDITAGISMAVAANLGLIVVKFPGNWIAKTLVCVGVLSAGMLGVLASFASNAIDTSCIHVVFLALITFVATSFIWKLLPGFRNYRLLAHSDDAPAGSAENQFRVLHLFYLVSGAAILLGLMRLLPFSLDGRTLLGDPVILVLIILLLAVTGVAAGLAVHRFALATGREVWWLLAATLLTPLVATVAAFVIGQINQGALEWNFWLMQRVLVSEFLFLCGTGLALRLLGYRLTPMRRA